MNVKTVVYTMSKMSVNASIHQVNHWSMNLLTVQCESCVNEMRTLPPKDNFIFSIDNFISVLFGRGEPRLIRQH